MDEIFFEDKYNENNEKASVGFDKKIIVFEDIDCVGDIVLAREHKKKNEVQPIIDVKPIVIDKETTKICEIPPMKMDDPVTLDDILNLWDGIRETPGRILIISSNHYDKLDPALTRPGRIDITLELSYASRNTIQEMYHHLFGETIDAKYLENIPDKFYSPAELINIYMAGDKNQEAFLERLMLCQHV